MAKPLPPRRNLDDTAPFLVSCKAGAAVFAEGDTATELYVIDEGSIELCAGDTVVATLGAGDYFGEMSFFHGAPRELGARAVTAARLFKIDRATFEQLVGEAPEIGVLMLARRARDPRPLPADPTPEPAATDPPALAAPGRLELPGSGDSVALPPLDEIRIGRVDPRAGITPEIDLTAFDPEKTSGRRHARLVRRDGRLFVVEDKATANGTFVGDTRVTPEHETEVPDGARLRFGMVETVYRAH